MKDDGIKFFIGQDLDSTAAYFSATGLGAAGMSTYTNISEYYHSLGGVYDPIDFGSGPMCAKTILERHPKMEILLGLCIVDKTGQNLNKIISGEHDKDLELLANFISDAPNTVYVRIGYEFDALWNRYAPELYRRSFRRISDILRDSCGEKFQAVWHSSCYQSGTFNNLPIKSWFPGEEYIDWVGISLFSKGPKRPHLEMLQLAAKIGKPVMICESSPWGFNLQKLTQIHIREDGRTEIDVESEQIWNLWFEPYFQFIRKFSDLIGIVTYINTNWLATEMFGDDFGMGDSRIQLNSWLLQKWKEQFSDASNDRFQHSHGAYLNHSFSNSCE